MNKIVHMRFKNPSPAAPRPSPAALRLARRMIAAGCVLSASTLGFAEGRVAGRVIDASSQAGLPGAEVSVVGGSARAITAADGSFSLSLPAGEHQLVTSYLGYPADTMKITVVDGATAPARVSLGSSDVVTLDTLTVRGAREGQARALNQQRSAANLTNIISSDLSGQFPDKTIADAAKRLPGITVETDSDTGGSEGRYITIRGMNADFNAVSINGMRAGVSDFSGLSRRVPLDVVSAKSADQIEVTKALRPDQDGDGVGGAVNIVTRGPFDRDGVYLALEGSGTYSAISDDYTSTYPYNDIGTEFSASFSSQLGKDGKHGIAISANQRDRAFLKQRVGTTGWRTVGGFYRPDAIALQHFFDDVTARGLNGTYEWRPTADAKFRADFSYSNRDTERGRQRQVVYYANVAPGAQNDGENYTDFTSSGGNSGFSRRVERTVRQFFEEQEILNGSITGEIKSGDWTYTPMFGFNRGSFDGDPERDIIARFRTARGTTGYQANGYLPRFSIAGVDRQDPDAYFLNRVDRGTSFVTDETYTTAFDAKRDASLFGGDGFWKAGVKGSYFDREYTKIENFFFAPSTDVAGGDVVADYRATSTLGGAYDYGFFIDPARVRQIADTPGVFAPGDAAADNLVRGRANSYDAKEQIHAGYGMGQFTWDKFTAMAGARVELTRVNFTGANANVNSSGDYVGPLTPYDKTNDYVDVLPGLHLRYEQTKNLLYRFAVTRSLARPRLSDLAPITARDDFDLEIRSGNIDLDPVRSTNLDLGAEYYIQSAGVLSAGLFYKDMRDNIYTSRGTTTIGSDTYTVISRANADSAWVRGFELGYDQQLTFLPAPLDGLGVFANYTYADSEVDTGLASFRGVDLPLFNQVRDTLNAGLFYEKGGFRSRLSVLYRSESLLDLSTNPGLAGSPYDPKLSRYLGATTTLDLTASYRFAKDWQIFAEFSNLLDEEGTAYNGTEARPDYYEITDWSATLGLRWNL